MQHKRLLTKRAARRKLKQPLMYTSISIFRGVRSGARLQSRLSWRTLDALLRATSMSQPGRALQSLEEVRAIVEAVEARDADAAARACEHHVQMAARAGLAASAADAG